MDVCWHSSAFQNYSVIMSLLAVSHFASCAARQLRRSAASRSVAFTRQLHATASRRDLAAEIDKQLHPRELVERKRKEMEAKYGAKLKQRAAS